MTAFAQGEFPAYYADFTMDHRDANGDFVETMPLPDSNVRGIVQMAFDGDGNLWACDEHALPTPSDPDGSYPGAGGEHDPDIVFLGGGRIIKWKRDGSLDTDWALTPAGRYSTDSGNLWPGGTVGVYHGTLIAPYTVCPLSTGLLVAEACDQQTSSDQRARLKLIDYETGTVIRTYGYFDGRADDGDSDLFYWVTAVDEDQGIFYYSTGSSVRRYDMVNDVLLSNYPFADKPANFGGISSAVRLNTLGQIVLYLAPGGTVGFEHGAFYIRTKDGTTVNSLNLNDVMMVDTASMHERIVQPGGWGCDIDDPTQVWASAVQVNQAPPQDVLASRFYHLDVSLSGTAAFLGSSNLPSGGHYPIGLPDGSFQTAYPGLARYRPDGSRVWLRTSFS